MLSLLLVASFYDMGLSLGFSGSHHQFSNAMARLSETAGPVSIFILTFRQLIPTIGIPTIIGYLMLNSVYTYILNI